MVAALCSVLLRVLEVLGRWMMGTAAAGASDCVDFQSTDDDICLVCRDDEGWFRC